ncbi:hypothetical protein Ciccas_008764 [Cichlidogyrus casuarinus]|uniref:Uncharacterized protein n=1 Tax=Cichlidogyrus casuarinus TaxID=1844966 RepID=A0ABD2PZW8_9PLAT
MDYTFFILPHDEDIESLPATLDGLHPSMEFTFEEASDSLGFLHVELSRDEDDKVQTSILS